MNPLILIPLTLVFAALYVIGRNEIIKRRLVCPRTGTSEDVGVVQRYGEPEKPVDVHSCSLLPDAKKIDCEKGCLDQLH